ncbi:hypothetical protein KUCAC02_029073, partial [Chaenocephalus aceratus]
AGLSLSGDDTVTCSTASNTISLSVITFHQPARAQTVCVSAPGHEPLAISMAPKRGRGGQRACLNEPLPSVLWLEGAQTIQTEEQRERDNMNPDRSRQGAGTQLILLSDCECCEGNAPLSMDRVMDRPMHAAGQPARGWRRLWVRGKQGLAGRGAVGGEPINADEEWVIWAGQEAPEHGKGTRREGVKGSRTPASLNHFILRGVPGNQQASV